MIAALAADFLLGVALTAWAYLTDDTARRQPQHVRSMR